MQAKTNMLCKLFDHKWRGSSIYDRKDEQEYPPYNLLRICERCNKIEVLVDMPENKWKILTG